MPFTLAHPAAVLPGTHPWARRLPLLDFPALVIGSMAPDFPYFWDFTPANQYGHSLPGIALFCLPVGLVAWGIWTWVQRPTLLRLLPESHRERLAAPWEKPIVGPAYWLAVPLSLGLGALTHVAWDAATHQNGALVRRWTFLARPIRPGGTFPVFKALQYGSGTLGLVALAVAYALWYRRAARKPASLPDGWKKGPPAIWLTVVLLAAAFAALSVLRTPDLAAHRGEAGFAALTAFLSGAYFAFTGFAVVFRARRSAAKAR